MGAFLTIVLSFPTVLFSIALVLSVLYWLTVLIGVVDLDGMDGALDGAADGVAEGAAEAVGEAAAEAAGEAAAEGAAQGLGGAGFGGAAGLLTALRPRAPLTVVGTLAALLGWFVSYFGTSMLAPRVPGPTWVGGFVVLLVAVLVAFPLASFLSRPLGQLLVIRAAKKRNDFLGQVCVVTTGRVDRKFGQALLEDGGAGLILAVRAEPGKLSRGDRALIVSYDELLEAYEVEPLDEMLESRHS